MMADRPMTERKVVMAIASDLVVSFSPSVAKKLGFISLSTYGGHGARLDGEKY